MLATGDCGSCHPHIDGALHRVLQQSGLPEQDHPVPDQDPAHGRDLGAAGTRQPLRMHAVFGVIAFGSLIYRLGRSSTPLRLAVDGALVLAALLFLRNWVA